ncbi:tRNA-splicing endonuclease subunit Sen2 [Maniola jurtina]|uniref:tRNA-splicing endonuclease subunit Sen2 n=1 Tax=Maniola jurtina TaxID=191418 RepID=UPI001E687FE9|nr:tRNA-splicing endonuclease subunit Sen2 [Maniola jurtina]
MNNLQSNGDSETDDPNNVFPLGAESSLQLPLDSSMCIVFTGHYNGVGVEVRSPDEMKLLYHMGCFGKGTVSRSRPKPITNSPPFMRRRQFLKRNYWYKRFGKLQKSFQPDTFFKDIDHLVAKILNDTKKQSGKEVIDLVSSDDDVQEEHASLTEHSDFDDSYKQNSVVIVPNSDSEDDNYFANLKPKYCVNKILLQEKLMLTLQEAFFLLYGLGCLQIVNAENNILNIEECWNLFSESESNFVEKYVVYHYFRSKGYIVKPGIKFGGDFLLYREGPEMNHADYIVVINFGKENLDWISLLGHVRMATTTVKEILIAEVTRSNKDNIKLPLELQEYSVRELVLTRKIPVIINNDDN